MTKQEARQAMLNGKKVTLGKSTFKGYSTWSYLTGKDYLCTICAEGDSWNFVDWFNLYAPENGWELA